MKETLIESRVEKPTVRWKRILAPTDFSERSQAAVRTATHLAEHCGAKITLLHVVQLPVLGWPETELAVDEFINSSSDALNEIASGVPTALLDEKIVRPNTQGIEREIIETARHISADLIVVAMHDCGPFTRALLGSTTEYLIRHAPCTVLVTRQNHGAERTVSPWTKRL